MMGIRLKLSSSTLGVPPACNNYTTNIVNNYIDVNPRPDNYEIEYSYEYGDFLILDVVYPNCTTFEGRKILVFKNVTLKDIQKQKLLDPHFSDNKKYHHPIARFEPSKEGIALAYKLVLL